MPPVRTLLLGVIAAGAVVTPHTGGQVIQAQGPIRLAGPADPGPTIPAAPTLNTIGARARRVLAQFDALTEPPADQTNRGDPLHNQQGGQELSDEPIDWDEALGLLEDLIAEDERAVVAAPEPGRFVSLRECCHARIAALPAEGLRAYRDRVDATARRLLEEARDRNDADKLRRVVDEFFCSSWGDDALLLLGDMALERGDTLAATRCWRRIAPAASDPLGRPLAWSLRGVDLQEQADEVAAIITGSPGADLVCPSSDVPLGEVLARLAVASLYEDNPEAAKTYAKMLQLLDPQASGVLAGRSGALAPIVEQMTADADSWLQPPQEAVGSLVGRVWPKPIFLSRPKTPPTRRPRIIVRGGRLQVAPDKPDAAPTPTVTPTIAGRLLVYREGSALRAVDLASGEPVLGPQGLFFKPAAPAAFPSRNDVRNQHRVLIRGNVVGRLPTVPADEPLTIVGNRLLARVVMPATGRPFGAPAIRSFDLTREGLESPVVKPIVEPWKIGGPAVADETRVYTAIVDHQTTSQVGLAAFSQSTGRELWRTSVASAPAQSAYGAVAAPRVGVTLRGETLLINTNLGAVAALDKQTGAPRWARLYRRSTPSPLEASGRGRTGEAPCVVAGARLFVAPTDCDHVFALDAATGRRLWTAPAAKGDYHLLGVVGKTLVVGGDQLRGLDIDTGHARYTWPDSHKAGVRGAGRGCLVAGEAFWPTRDRVLVFDAQRGTQTRLPIDIVDLGGGGANLVPAGELLVAAGVKGMTVFGPVNRQTKDGTPLLSLAPSF